MRYSMLPILFSALLAAFAAGCAADSVAPVADTATGADSGHSADVPSDVADVEPSDTPTDTSVSEDTGSSEDSQAMDLSVTPDTLVDALPLDADGGPVEIDGVSLDTSTDSESDAGPNEDVGELACVGPYAIATAADVAAISHCTTFQGDLIVEGSMIVDFSGLDDLEVLNGDLRVIGNGALTSLTGLSGLTAIGGYFNVSDNPALVTLGGLDSLKTISGYALLYGNSALTDLSGLSALVAVGGYLEINECDAVVSLAGLESLTSLGEDLDLRNNDALSDISALSKLTALQVGGGGVSLSVLVNPSLQNLNGLEGIVFIAGNVQVMGNETLSDVSGLGNVTELLGDFVMTVNQQLCQADADALALSMSASGIIDTTGNKSCQI